jgi:ribonuclease HI
MPRKNPEPVEDNLPKPNVTIYVDGCCLKNPGGAGGWGAVLQYGKVEKWFSGHLPETTSSRAELVAIIEALRRLKVPCQVTLYSDSQNTIRCANGEHQRRSNLDLWAEWKALDDVHQVDYQWIYGHNGTPGNERAHQLAQRAANGVIESS